MGERAAVDMINRTFGLTKDSLMFAVCEGADAADVYETILTDLSPELADEIVAAGYGEYVEVGIPADEIVDGDGNPVDANEAAIGDNETA